MVRKNANHYLGIQQSKGNDWVCPRWCPGSYPMSSSSSGRGHKWCLASPHQDAQVQELPLTSIRRQSGTHLLCPGCKLEKKLDQEAHSLFETHQHSLGQHRRGAFEVILFESLHPWLLACKNKNELNLVSATGIYYFFHHTYSLFPLWLPWLHEAEVPGNTGTPNAAAEPKSPEPFPNRQDLRKLDIQIQVKI